MGQIYCIEGCNVSCYTLAEYPPPPPPPPRGAELVGHVISLRSVTDKVQSTCNLARLFMHVEWRADKPRQRGKLQTSSHQANRDHPGCS